MICDNAALNNPFVLIQQHIQLLQDVSRTLLFQGANQILIAQASDSYEVLKHQQTAFSFVLNN